MGSYQVNKTGIAWTDRTWNVATGCSKVSQGCKHCYAERIFHRPYPGRDFTDVRTHPDRLDQPLHIRKPQRIFVNSMSDLFHEDVPDDFLDSVFTTMRRCEVMGKGHIFQVLTKRPQRMLDFMRPIPTPGNLWLGVSVEDQETAYERINLLLSTPAAVRFVSYEPALGPVNFKPWLKPIGVVSPDPHGRDQALDWIIVGGESGPKARPFNIEWASSTIEQCKAAGCAVFVKQLGSMPYQADDRAIWSYPSNRHLKHRAGADPSEWPQDLRVQCFPD